MLLLALLLCVNSQGFIAPNRDKGSGALVEEVLNINLRYGSNPRRDEELAAPVWDPGMPGQKV